MNVERPSLLSRPAYPSHAGIAAMAVACLLAPLPQAHAEEMPDKTSGTSEKSTQRPPGVVSGKPAPTKNGSDRDGDRNCGTDGEGREESVPVPGQSKIEPPTKNRETDGSPVRPEGQAKSEPKDARPVFKGVVLRMPSDIKDIPQPRRNESR